MHHPTIYSALAAERQRDLRASGRAARSRGPDKPRPERPERTPAPVCCPRLKRA